ncbi:MAG: nitrate reductase [Thermoanaerobaculales bacterium]|nr:nitrate reductase [Thermoanaerobaculales bacterium]
MSATRRQFMVASAATSALAALGKPTKAFAAAGGGIKWTKGVCRYCGVGCGVYKGVRDGKLVAIKGDKENHNDGYVCLKGFLLPQILYHEDRLTHPLIKKNGKLVKASWDEALDLVAKKFTESVKKNGKDSVAFYGSGQAYTEESYAASKLFRAGFGTNNVEGNPRLCMASAVGGYVTTFGKDEPMGTYDDIDNADVFFIIGSNTAEAHPVLFQRIARRKKADPNVKIIVADPRMTPTGRIADIYLKFKPNTDLFVLNAFANYFVQNDLVDKEFIKNHLAFGKGKAADQNWDAYVAFLAPYTMEKAAEVSGCPIEDLTTAAKLFGCKKNRTMSMWTMGINQRLRGVWGNNLIHNLHLITGKIGIPGSTTFSLTGQPNACGGVRDQGGLCHILPYGRLVKKPEHRAEVEKIWGVPPGTIGDKPGKHTLAMFQALETKDIKCIYIMCTNPGHSLPNVNRYRKAMADPDTFVVVADIYPTRTTELADVVLPAAAWSEKEGVYGCSERRYQLEHAVVLPQGEARPDFDILVDLAARCGYGKLMPWKSPDDAWEELLLLAEGTMYQIGGITRARLRKDHGVIWPCPTEDHPGTKLRYVKGEDPWVPDDYPHRIMFYGKPDNRAVVWFRPWENAAEMPDEEYPFFFTTGRVIEHWHTATMTGRCKELKHAKITSEVEIHPDDAKKLGVRTGDGVRVTSRRDSLVFPALVTDNSQPGLVFVHMHDDNLKRMCNKITIDQFDPGSKEPTFKICAVKLAKA